MAMRAKFMCNMWRIVPVEGREWMVGGGEKKKKKKRKRADKGSHGTHAE